MKDPGWFELRLHMLWNFSVERGNCEGVDGLDWIELDRVDCPLKKSIFKIRWKSLPVYYLKPEVKSYLSFVEDVYTDDVCSKFHAVKDPIEAHQ